MEKGVGSRAPEPGWGAVPGDWELTRLLGVGAARWLPEDISHRANNLGRAEA